MIKIRKTPCIHVLVANLFCDKSNIQKKLCINHIDGNKHNNKSSNLEWITLSANTKHVYDIELKKISSKPIIMMDLNNNIIDEFN